MYFDLGKENFHLTSKLLNINNNATLTKQYNHDDLISVINKSDVCSVCCLPMPFRKSSWRRVFVHLITISTFDQEIGPFDWVYGVYVCINSNMFQCKVIYSNSIWLSICYFLKVFKHRRAVIYRYISKIMMDAIYVLLLLIFTGTNVYGELQIHSINVFKELLSSVFCNFGVEFPESVSQNRICFYWLSTPALGF